MAELATVAAFGFDDFDPPIILDLYRQLGCKSCQFYRNEANPPTVDDVRRITRDADVPVDSIHGVFGSRYDPASTDESHRREVIEIYRREGELALALGGPMVVVHPSNLAPEGHTPTDTERADRVDPLRRSIAELAAIGQRQGVVYVWENNPHNMWIGNDPLQLANLLREIDSPHARMCYDTGHAKMTGDVSGRIVNCADVIAYLHIHDNDGVIDDHRMPGDGVIDWEQFREALREAAINVPAMLEVFYLADKLRELATGDLPAKLSHWMNDPAAAKAGSSSAS